MFHKVVATLVRCGGIFNANFIANFLMSQPVKKLWKLADIWRSYRKSNKGDVFLRQSVNLTTTTTTTTTVLRPFVLDNPDELVPEA